MLKSFGKYTDVILALALIFMLGLMLIPMSPVILDLFLAINITLAILILVVSLYIRSPLDISVFPGLLLVLTLFRLALNISSTRLILIDGYAGKVIESFGMFVVSGNYVVGFIVFLILVLIQFIVIVKGSGRISEVAARFTLDAMPGKQMAIDADLNAGLINENEARARRDSIGREAEFYGAMDGASKFVKGDAIAGILISAINILGGFIIGVVQKGMSLVESLETYTILTIGDGLVSQIPALLIATAAGLVVTRNTSGLAFDIQLKKQLFTNSRILAMVAAVIILFGLLPGIPTFTFISIGLVLSAGSYLTKKHFQMAEQQAEIKAEEPVAQEDKVERYLQVDPIEIEIGYGLISLVEDTSGGLFGKISSTRKFIALEYGVLVPPVRVRDNLQLSPNEYIIKIKGNLVADYEIYIDRVLAMNPGNADESLSGIPTKDPAFNLEGVWIFDSEKEKAELAGYTVVDGLSVLSTHLQETIKKNFDKILTRQAVKQLLENLKADYPAVIDDINLELLPLGTIQKVLQNLLKEFIPIKDLVQILEAMIDYSKVTKNVDVLSEYIRHSIGDTIASIYKDNNGVIHAAAIGEKLESEIITALQNQKDAIKTLGLNPATLHELNGVLQRVVNQFNLIGFTPVVITSATIRPYFYRLINSSFPEIAVLSYSELPAQLEIEFIDKIEVEYAD